MQNNNAQRALSWKYLILSYSLTFFGYLTRAERDVVIPPISFKL